MALGGAWVRTVLGANYVVFEGRTAAADGDSMVLGKDGDGGADTGFTLPAGWPTCGTDDGPGGVPTDANLHLRTRVAVIPLSDNGLAAGGAGVGFSIAQGSAPFQKTIQMNGTPNAAVTLRVEVQYINSSIR